jgi:hypothetical protein
MGGLVLGALVLLALGITSFVHSDRYSGLAASQRITTAQGTRTYRSTRDSSGHINSHLDCTYHFTVDGAVFNGSDCPPNDATESTENQSLYNLTGAQQFTATVYYDPNDPSTNSLMEFTARGGLDHALGIILVALGIILLGVVAFGALVSNNQSGVAPAVAAAPVAPETMPEGSTPSGQQFLDDLDKVLRSEPPTDHSSGD